MDRFGKRAGMGSRWRDVFPQEIVLLSPALAGQKRPDSLRCTVDGGEFFRCAGRQARHFQEQTGFQQNGGQRFIEFATQKVHNGSAQRGRIPLAPPQGALDLSHEAVHAGDGQVDFKRGCIRLGCVHRVQFIRFGFDHTGIENDQIEPSLAQLRDGVAEILCDEYGSANRPLEAGRNVRSSVGCGNKQNHGDLGCNPTTTNLCIAERWDTLQCWHAL